MACLVQDGLVDLGAPSESKILGWISRAQPDNELITAQVIEAERAGFQQWIEASAECPSACRGATCPAQASGSSCAVAREPDAIADETPDGCADRALEQLFQSDVYAWRGRCFPCHFENQPNQDPTAPAWIKTGGNCVTASLATLRAAVASGYVDVAEPERSLLLLKPLDVLVEGEGHGGGQKFEDTSDPAYVSFLRFLERYSECRATP
jgi:hypothetical protein